MLKPVVGCCAGVPNRDGALAANGVAPAPNAGVVAPKAGLFAPNKPDQQGSDATNMARNHVQKAQRHRRHAPPPPKADAVLAPNPKAGADCPNREGPVAPAAAELLKEKAGVEPAPKVAADEALKPKGVPVLGVPNAAEDAPKAGDVDPKAEAAEL